MEISWLNVVVRFAHLLAAMIAVGGAIFAAFVVMPAARMVPGESRTHFNEALRKRFNMLVMLAISLLLLTGFYNYIVNEMPAHKGQGLYHALMGVKILLAFGVFLLASALTGHSKAFEPFRAKRKRWMTVNLLLAVAVVAIGAVLRAIPDVDL